MAKYCANCGGNLKNGEEACPKCGTIVDTNKTVKITNNITAPAASGSNGLAVAGFVVSLVSSLLCCGSFNIVGLVLSIIGLVKSKELNGAGKGLAIAGIIIACIFFIIDIFFAMIYYGAAFYSAFSCIL